jgi:hypothetical protein
MLLEKVVVLSKQPFVGRKPQRSETNKRGRTPHMIWWHYQQGVETPNTSRTIEKAYNKAQIIGNGTLQIHEETRAETHISVVF